MIDRQPLLVASALDAFLQEQHGLLNDVAAHLVFVQDDMVFLGIKSGKMRKVTLPSGKVGYSSWEHIGEVGNRVLDAAKSHGEMARLLQTVRFGIYLL